MLEEAGIDVGLVVGSSVGSVIGAYWAAGPNGAEIDALSRTGGPLTVFDPSPFADRGWIHGQRLQDFVQAGVAGRPLEQLPRRLIVVATRREDKSARFFEAGHAGVAVRASSVMPRIVSPVGIASVEYEGADVSLPVAVRAARTAGARVVVAVDLVPTRDRIATDAPDWMAEDLLQRRARSDAELRFADVVVQPTTGVVARPIEEPLMLVLRHRRAPGAAGARGRAQPVAGLAVAPLADHARPLDRRPSALRPDMAHVVAHALMEPELHDGKVCRSTGRSCRRPPRWCRPSSGCSATDHVLQVTGGPAEDFESITRRYAAAPAAQPTLAKRLRQFALFIAHRAAGMAGQVIDIPMI